MSLFRMPSLGSDMTAGTLVEQALSPGEAFKRGDIIAAVETQKGVIEVEVFEDGILDKWLVDLGTEVPVGTPLAELRGTGEPEPDKLDISSKVRPAPEPPESGAPELPLEPTTSTPRDRRPESRPIQQAVEPPAEGVTGQQDPHPAPLQRPRQRITPAARRLAAAQGIDLSAVSLRGDEVLTRKDVERLAGRSAPAEGSPVQNAGSAQDMRAAIAAAMSRSKREIPHYYLSHLVDLSAVDAFLSRQNAARSPAERLLAGAVYGRAIALALKSFPEFNGHNGPEGFEPSEAINVGMAIHIRSGGLVAPALFDVAGKTVDVVMTELRDLVARVRAGQFRARELTDATITLTSLGERGVDQVVGVIYPPQVAIVGLGTPRPVPVVEGDEVIPRLSASLTLAADHRVSDGHRGALFLRALAANLQEPEKL